MSRFKLIIEYNGTPFCGWQRQEGLSTVQGTLEEAFADFLGEPVTVWGGGRTDAGVSLPEGCPYRYAQALFLSLPFKEL